MKLYTAIAVTNVCLCCLAAFVCWTTKSGWGLLALFFMVGEKRRENEE